MTFENKTDYELHEVTIINWLETFAGLSAGSVRMLNQESVRPPLPYGTIQLLVGGVMEGQDSQHFEYNSSTDKLDVITHGPRRMTAQIAVYTEPGREDIEGRSARIKLDTAIAALRSPSVLETFQLAGLAFMQLLSPPRAFDEQLGDRWERRMQADLEFGFTSVFVDKSTAAEGGIGWIETNDDPIVTVLE